MASKAQLFLRDFDGTRKSLSVDVIPAATDLQMGGLIDALKIWTIGANDGEYRVDERAAPSGVAAASPVAQAELSVIIEMKDSVNGHVYTERLPMPDTTKAVDGSANPAWTVVGQGSESLTIMNPAHSDYTVLETAINAIWQSPEGNAGTLVRAYID